MLLLHNHPVVFIFSNSGINISEIEVVGFNEEIPTRSAFLAMKRLSPWQPSLILISPQARRSRAGTSSRSINAPQPQGGLMGIFG